MGERVYLTLRDLLFIHGEQIKLFGGADGIRDIDLLLSALQRPQSGYHVDLIDEAAVLWESLTMNHGFVDGNKRVGLAAADVFLRLNGHKIHADNATLLAFITDHLEAGRFRKPALEEFLRRHAVPR
ncbi:death on curing protein [Devosia enhydra]|uniref:Death on curing protein n=1 Tax=Devosia enhydra TaxID=665118 RepID=A0A1K2HTM1_9HYPH|nr:death on curing protein [Devosia enhydra]